MPTTAVATTKEPETNQKSRAAADQPTQVSHEPLPQEFDAAAHHEEIAQVAYRIWLERADEPGSPEQDWLKAVSEVCAKYTR